MKNFARYISAKSFALSSAFFIGFMKLPINKVEAACPPGQYASNGTTCATVGGGVTSGRDPIKNVVAPEFASIYNNAAQILMAVTLLTIISAGYMYMTSSGDAKKLAQAKKMLIGSGFAIIVLASSYTLYSFFGNLFAGGLVG